MDCLWTASEIPNLPKPPYQNQNHNESSKHKQNAADEPESQAIGPKKESIGNIGTRAPETPSPAPPDHYSILIYIPYTPPLRRKPTAT